MNLLGWLRSIKAKLAIVIVAAIGTAVVTSQVGYWLGWPIWVRPTIAASISLIAVQFLGTGMTQPLRDMANAARRMADGHYDQRVETSSVDEVGQLAKAFNSMATAVADADRQQRDLIGNVSHELRTPVAGLRATVENLVDGVIQPTPEVLATLQGRINRIERLVADLLDLSRLEAGIVPLNVSTIDVRDLVDGVVAECQESGATSSITVNVQDRMTVLGDADRLAQVLRNLIENALRHGDGAVAVLANMQSGVAVFEVADCGPGITGDPERLFDRFYRADAAPNTGTGLGLAIVRWIVDLHHGQVSARANSPTGSRFIVTLPLS